MKTNTTISIISITLFSIFLTACATSLPVDPNKLLWKKTNDNPPCWFMERSIYKFEYYKDTSWSGECIKTNIDGVGVLRMEGHKTKKIDRYQKGLAIDGLLQGVWVEIYGKKSIGHRLIITVYDKGKYIGGYLEDIELPREQLGRAPKLIDSAYIINGNRPTISRGEIELEVKDWSEYSYTPTMTDPVTRTQQAEIEKKERNKSEKLRTEAERRETNRIAAEKNRIDAEKIISEKYAKSKSEMMIATTNLQRISTQPYSSNQSSLVWPTEGGIEQWGYRRPTTCSPDQEYLRPLINRFDRQYMEGHSNFEKDLAPANFYLSGTATNFYSAPDVRIALQKDLIGAQQIINSVYETATNHTKTQSNLSLKDRKMTIDKIRTFSYSIQCKTATNLSMSDSLLCGMALQLLGATVRLENVIQHACRLGISSPSYPNTPTLPVEVQTTTSTKPVMHVPVIQKSKSTVRNCDINPKTVCTAQ